MSPLLSILRLLSFVWLLFWLDHRYVPSPNHQWWQVPYALTIGIISIAMALWTIGDISLWIEENNDDDDPSATPAEPMSHVCPQCRHQFVEEGE